MHEAYLRSWAEENRRTLAEYRRRHARAEVALGLLVGGLIAVVVLLV